MENGILEIKTKNLMAVVYGMSHGVILAEAIGLETKDLHSFTVEVNPDDVITVKATYYVTQDGLEELKKVVKTFTLQSNDGD